MSLQWSHPLSAVEITWEKVDTLVGGVKQVLQWSHPLSAVEINRSSGHRAAQTLSENLQWSHPLSAVEMDQLPSEDHLDRLDVPSMEPPPFGGGNVTPCATGQLTCGKPSFNGATPFRRWKWRSLRGRRPYDHAE